jgi:hypothetical protein
MNEFDYDEWDDLGDLEAIEEMFVQLAGGLTSFGTPDDVDVVLRLEGVAPSTLYFSDRPVRVVGHMTNEQFIDQWSSGPDSFELDPPNAVLSFPDASGKLEDAVLVLRSPVLDENTFEYRADVLEGDVPSNAGPCTLFIDPLGRPLSPVSVAGMNRRDRRRARGGG